MNQETPELLRQIELWEPSDAEVVRVIDIHEDTIERIVRRGDRYFMYRYFTLGDRPEVYTSVDLESVDADRIIQELGERVC